MKPHILTGFKSNKIQTHSGPQGPVTWTLPASPLPSVLTTFHSHLPSPRPWLPLSPWMPTTCQVCPQPTLFFTTGCFSAFPVVLWLLREALDILCKGSLPLTSCSQPRGCLLLNLSYWDSQSPGRCSLPKRITWPHKAEMVSVLAATVLQGPQHCPASGGF